MENNTTDLTSLSKEADNLYKKYDDSKIRFEKEAPAIMKELGNTPLVNKKSEDITPLDFVKNTKAKIKRNALTSEYSKLVEEQESYFYEYLEKNSILAVIETQITRNPFKLLTFTYDGSQLSASIENTKAQVVYRDLFNPSKLEVKTMFGNSVDYSIENEKESVLRNKKLLDFQEFKDFKKVCLNIRKEQNLQRATVISHSDVEKENVLIRTEREILNTITEQEYIELFTLLMQDLQLFKEVKAFG